MYKHDQYSVTCACLKPSARLTQFAVGVALDLKPSQERQGKEI